MNTPSTDRNENLRECCFTVKCTPCRMLHIFKLLISVDILTRYLFIHLPLLVPQDPPASLAVLLLWSLLTCGGTSFLSCQQCTLMPVRIIKNMFTVLSIILALSSHCIIIISLLSGGWTVFLLHTGTKYSKETELNSLSLLKKKKV